MASSPSWHDKLLGGFRRTSDRLLGNLAGITAGRLDEAQLDEVEEALIASDFAPVQGFVLTMAILYILLNLAIDLLYGVVDPRMRAA